mmetsp:Transcript_8417/g.24060  ORF Transcript_8417/g.24060 Transcript_8417/m.24060 type:complete len:205 (+) Transcript_8417:401-1015(+)
MAVLLDDFGRHPRNRAPQALRHRVRRPLRTTKVRQLHLAIQPDEDVGALDVPMQDDGFLSVEVLQALQQLAGIGSDQALVQRAELGQHLGHGSPGHVLQVDVQVVIQVVVPEVPDDVGVRQLLVDAHLVLQIRLVLQVGFESAIDADLLHRERLACPLVERLVDGAQGAMPKHFPLHPRQARLAPHGAGRTQCALEARARSAEG